VIEALLRRNGGTGRKGGAERYKREEIGQGVRNSQNAERFVQSWKIAKKMESDEGRRQSEHRSDVELRVGGRLEWIASEGHRKTKMTLPKRPGGRRARRSRGSILGTKKLGRATDGIELQAQVD